ncbi:hypothetical protein B0H17DRAFT_118894 [Mycena rosella]|uniref:Uncharacterized protein n=1 Tax=Mycena rosella TaxID=1033263 RepID=A0AAD7E1K6_MYCRO|nr:hypothetical protein B0H17DRAFT_118894 [Mycena rosella]
MSVVFTDNGGVEWQDIDQQQGFWSSLRKLSSPSRVRTETWERTRLHVRRALEILKGFRAETLDYIASILQDISGWNTAVTTKVNELALNLVELYVTLLISMAPEVKNLPPEVFEQLAGILTRVRDLVEHRSRLSLTQRYIRRKQFRKEITFHRRALINVLAPCSKSTAVRRNFIIESQIRLDEAHSTLHGSMHDHPGRALTDSPDGEDARSVSSTLEADDGISIVRRTKRGSVARSSDGESVKYPARIFHPMTLTQNIGSPATTATLVSTLSSESIETPEHVEGPRLADVLEVPSEDAVVETPQVPTGPNIASEEAPALEPTPSPLSTKSHFPILYLPTPSDAGPSNASAFRCEDATALEDDLPEGGVTVSVHSPDGAVAWVELHYDDPLLETLRARGFSGPIAVQLSPAESALAVFGSIADELIPQLARELAQASGFAVMVRSRKDNPVAGFTQPEIETPPAKGPVTVSVAPVARLRGGAGEPDDDEEERYMTPQWEGKYHNTTVDLKLKMNEATAYDVKVCAYTKFKTQPADHANSSKVGPRPEVLSSVSLEVKLRRGETMLDRSFSNIGFLVHRPQSIVKCDFLDFGYSPPDVKLKRTNQTSTAVSGGGGVSLTGVVPTFSGNASYTRTGGDTLESADEKPMPRCEMRYDLGKGWERVDADDLGKDFESYDITWRPASDRDNVAHEMYVEFGLGMHLRQDELAEGLPPISFVLRNQIMVWVSDPALHSKGRGILLLTSVRESVRLSFSC